jgi:hypothetical protein
MTCFIVFNTCFVNEDKAVYQTETECLMAAQDKAIKLVKYIEQKTKEVATVNYTCKQLESV